jgi:hypothetical protein
VPELEFDGERIGQSNSIARFLAREYGLAGKNNIEAAQLDAIIDSSADILNGEYFFLSISCQSFHVHVASYVFQLA